MYGNSDPFSNGEIILWNTLRPVSRVVFDVGCQEDDYYLVGNSDIQFHLFEPNAPSYEMVKKKVAGLPNVILNNFGLAATSGELSYYEKANSFVNRFGEAPSATFQVRTLSEYISSNRIEEIDFMKIDTEGFELDVMLGAGDFIGKIPYIQFEYGGTYRDRGISMSDVYDHLKPFGFNFFILHQDGLYPRPEPHEHGNYSNYLATLNVDTVNKLITK